MIAEFGNAALPWIVLGLAMALFAAFHKQLAQNPNATLLIAVGTLLGIVIGAMGAVSLGLGIALGLLGGLAAALLIGR